MIHQKGIHHVDYICNVQWGVADSGCHLSVPALINNMFCAIAAVMDQSVQKIFPRVAMHVYVVSEVIDVININEHARTGYLGY